MSLVWPCQRCARSGYLCLSHFRELSLKTQRILLRSLTFQSVHSKVPEFSWSELTIVEAVSKDQEAAEHQEVWHHQPDMEVENLKWREDRLVRYAALKPEEQRPPCSDISWSRKGPMMFQPWRWWMYALTNLRAVRDSPYSGAVL